MPLTYNRATSIHDGFINITGRFSLIAFRRERTSIASCLITIFTTTTFKILRASEFTFKDNIMSMVHIIIIDCKCSLNFWEPTTMIIKIKCANIYICIHDFYTQFMILRGTSIVVYSVRAVIKHLRYIWVIINKIREKGMSYCLK